MFAASGLELKKWLPAEQTQYTHPDEGTGEYSETFAMWGLDREYATLLGSHPGDKILIAEVEEARRRLR